MKAKSHRIKETIPSAHRVSPYFIYCDVGTTFIKAGLWDSQKNRFQKKIKIKSPSVVPNNDRYESCALFYVKTIEEALQPLTHHKIWSGTKPVVMFCFQRSSFVLFDTHRLEPVSPLIMWKDQRASFVNDWTYNAKMQFFNETGIPVTPFYVGPKLKWLIDHDASLWNKLFNHRIGWGTLDAWCLYYWSQGKYHITDHTMASRTGLYDVHRLQWSENIFKFYGIPFRGMPSVMSFSDFKTPLSLSVGFDWGGSVADQVASLSGVSSFKSQAGCLNFGSAIFLTHWQQQKKQARHQILKTPVLIGTPRKKVWMMEAPINSSISPSWKARHFRIKDLQNHTFYFYESPLVGAPFWFKAPAPLKSSVSEDILNLIFRIAYMICYLKLKTVYVTGGGATCMPLIKLLSALIHTPFWVVPSSSEYGALEGLKQLKGVPSALKIKAVSQPKHLPEDVIKLWRKYNIWIKTFLGK